MQDASAVCPVAVPYVPATQSVQLEWAARVLYLPAPHAVHAPPSGPDQPALQVHCVKLELPADELEFVGQSLQLADPVDALYFPATHAVHVSPSGPAEPALQEHAVKEVLPADTLEVSAVKSTPRTMRSAMTEVASVLRYSSTTKTPAISPLRLMPNLVAAEVMSVIIPEAVPEEPRALFTVNQYSCVDARYLPTIVNHIPCSSTSYALTPPAMKNCELLSESCLDKYIIFPW